MVAPSDLQSPLFKPVRKLYAVSIKMLLVLILHETIRSPRPNARNDGNLYQPETQCSSTVISHASWIFMSYVF